MKSRRVCIKTRSPPASLPLKGQVTRHTTVKWPITSHQEQLMKEADHVIVLYKGRVLGRGTFTELNDKGILNTTVDLQYEKMNENSSGKSFRAKSEEKHDVSDSRGGIVPQTDEAKGLQISEEDRTIGVVSSKLYWNYFRSGVPSLVIIVVLCLCLITQGNHKHFFVMLHLSLHRQI